ncbi:MAG: 4-hydroxy-tetrahydrodipicolinate reductase [Desulfotomaculum sp. 46_296]|nr:MAG: 4-hydroxy-tetrahydrodipicolinate reductase [Desulfotomaculum sp. 46_296]KUK84883.1 MAG: 4-hydroxy-tetrahydrodipicolinate reductase [Desulfofundulus kuznetsovii]HAU31496.1 4-hydroxy-tetrahydrodipicolinate reductase [Desulfotomaculum sp.]
MIRVIVSGAAGRMGREVLKSVWNSEDMQLVGAVDIQDKGRDAGLLMGIGEVGIQLQNDLEQALQNTRPDVMVDFTIPDSVAGNIKTALRCGVRPVVGTTGLPGSELSEITRISSSKKIGCIIAPNFAIGAILMINFASRAAKYFPHVEIIELHHDQKLDAPSGTAILTAAEIVKNRGDFEQGLPIEVEKISGARGGRYEGGIRLHSVRLPGLVAHQEVIFGGLGQTLTIRHDTISRESFMPGVLLAIRKVMFLEEVVCGLENLIFE